MNEQRVISRTGTAFRQPLSHPSSGGWTIEQASHMTDVRKACRIVLLITKEMAFVAGERIAIAAERRRSVAHYRQIAMYVCHVSLQISLSEIGLAFGRDRTTVAYSCRVIEDRRDDRGFDAISTLTVGLLIP